MEYDLEYPELNQRGQLKEQYII